MLAWLKLKIILYFFLISIMTFIFFNYSLFALNSFLDSLTSYHIWYLYQI
jgi:surface polysaccharide O-acyltransferase-like enzyme